MECQERASKDTTRTSCSRNSNATSTLEIQKPGRRKLSSIARELVTTEPKPAKIVLEPPPVTQ
jgi:hypothetical protein